MLTYRTQLVPTSRRQRPGYVLKPTSITVHNTANPNATAANHGDYLANANRSASWHICVDDKEAVLSIPLNEQAWHAGTNAGNTTSIGIEVCEFSNRARQDATDENAQRLIADMLTGKAPAGFKASHLSIKDVRTHQSWSGKYCPRMLIPWWDRFIAETAALTKEAPTVNHIYGVVVDNHVLRHRAALRAIAEQYNDRIVEGETTVAYHAAEGANADAYIAYAKANGLEHQSVTNGSHLCMVLRSKGAPPTTDQAEQIAHLEAQLTAVTGHLRNALAEALK